MSCDIMKETKKFLNNLLKENDVVVVACSGGPDSMFLLHAINLLKEKKNIKIVCAHVNHGLRKESVDEAKFVENYCVINNIIFEYMIIDSYSKNKFSEEEGRSKRYDFFELLIKKYNAKYLMTAHHGDDLIETVMMRIVRGSNLKGYAGISKISHNKEYSIVRPLLNLSKKEILEYLDTNKIKYVIDESNNNEKYTRNRYRKHLLPFLKKEDHNVHLKFLKYSTELERANMFINSVVKSKLKDIYVENYIVINKLLEEETYIQEKIIEYVIENIQKKYIFNINDKQLKNIIELINSNKNSFINLADGFIARKSYNKLYIEKNKEVRTYNLKFDNDIKILDKYIFKLIQDSNEKSNFLIRLNSNEVKLPLIIRTKQNGDRIKVKNLFGTKKVKDIFINHKIDLEKREEYPIVVDSNNNVLWIPGIKKSIFDKENNEKYDIMIKYTEERNE